MTLRERVKLLADILRKLAQDAEPEANTESISELKWYARGRITGYLVAIEALERMLRDCAEPVEAGGKQ